MRLRKQLRGRSLKCAEFRRMWRAAGLSTLMKNREIKDYLGKLRSESSESVTPTNERTEHAIGCDPEINCECEP